MERKTVHDAQKAGPLVVNLLSGPGAGKSTLAAMIFAELKRAATPWTVELAVEFAKELVWEGRIDALANQMYVMGEQFQRIERVANQAHVVVTDSPCIFSAIYKPKEYPDSLTDLALWCHRRFPSINVFVERPDAPYEAIGRVQTREQAQEIDDRILSFLEAHRISPIFRCRPCREDAERIAGKALKWVENQQAGPRTAA